MERTGHSQVDEVIEQFLASPTCWIGGVGETPTESLRDPEFATGKCHELAQRFERLLAATDIQAQVMEVEHPEQILYLDATRVPPYTHSVTTVAQEDGLWMIDWTAAQYGYAEFPMVQRWDESLQRWQR